MTTYRKDFYGKTLLMLALAGAILGVARAGYDEGDVMEEDITAQGESEATRAAHARLLIQTLSEEFTEINALASQQVKFREMGDAQSTRIARMYGRWIRDHKAGIPALARLIRIHGGDPETATELKAPVLGTSSEMLAAIHKDHLAAVRTSQQRYGATNEWAIQWFMHSRAKLARKHLAEMKKYHGM